MLASVFLFPPLKADDLFRFHTLLSTTTKAARLDFCPFFVLLHFILSCKTRVQKALEGVLL